MRLAPRAVVHPRHRNPAVTYEVDCRMLFLGERIHDVPRAFEQIAYHFAAAAEPARLFRKLGASAEIGQFYLVERTPRGTVSVRLRDEIFREPAPADDLDVVVTVSDGRRSFDEPCPPSRWKALGHLLPLLAGNRSADEVDEELASGLSPADAAWAEEFRRRLEQNGFLVEHDGSPSSFDRPAAPPRVTLIGHSSLLVQSARGALLVDPLLRVDLGTPERALDLTRLDLDAIVCSHAHWDHCDLQTLLLLDKRIPIIIPRIVRPTAFNPPIAAALARLGFRDIREADAWTPLRVGDFEIVPVPFHGEQDEPGIEIDHFTYVIRTEGLSLYGGVDGYRDDRGDMLEVLDRLRRDHRPSIAFLPVSKMVYDYRTGGVNGFCRSFDADLQGRSFQYTASAADAARWAERLQPTYVVPYALFAFPRWSTSPEIMDFGGCLARVGLAERFSPLRPLEALDARDLAAGLRAEIRRRTRVAGHRLADALRRIDARARQHAAYRLSRRAVRAALTEARRGARS